MKVTAVSTTRVLIDDDSGLPVARLRNDPDLKDFDYESLPNTYQTPADVIWGGEFTGVASYRYREAFLAHTRDDWYNHNTDNEFIEAFIRVHDAAPSDGFAVRVFSRWMRAYHPMIPFKFVTLQTGYSQGDWVEMLFVGDPDFWDWLDSPIKRSHAALESIDSTVKEFGAFTRGDYHKFVVETSKLTYDPAADQVDLEWETDETLFVLALEAFTVTEENVTDALDYADVSTEGRTWVAV